MIYKHSNASILDSQDFNHGVPYPLSLAHKYEPGENK